MRSEIKNDVMTITIDDGKANVISHALLDELVPTLENAKTQVKAVLLTGRVGLFSAGFDLKEFQKGPSQTKALVSRGYDLLYRLYGYPLPLVSACSGHGIALGAFILLASDTRFGCAGDFKISLPETAISMQLSPLLMELASARLSKRHLIRAAVQSENYDPVSAIGAGFLDAVVSAEALLETAFAEAEKLSKLPTEFYAMNKLLARKSSLELMSKNLKA
jgi:enoyl-CoA hydratase